MDNILVESPDVIYGRLLESVNTSGYTMERACIALEWLIEDGKWKELGTGFDDINKFLETVNLSEFKIAVDRRKKLSKQLNELQATQRSTAKALGVNQTTILRDIGNDANASEEKDNYIQGNDIKNTGDANASVPTLLSKPASEVIQEAEKAENNKEKKIIKQQEIEQQRIEIEASIEPEIKDNYNIIAIDPPWNYGREYDPESSRVANPYPEMTQDELKQFKIHPADDCIIFLWTTHAFLWDAKELLDLWGFTYKANLVWDKEKMGMGAWFRMQCEFCLVGIKGKPYFNNTKWRDIIREPRREHSRKPEVFYTMVSEITAGKKIEYFSRGNREGWESMGNDTEKFT